MVAKFASVRWGGGGERSAAVMAWEGETRLCWGGKGRNGGHFVTALDERRKQ